MTTIKLRFFGGSAATVATINAIETPSLRRRGTVIDEQSSSIVVIV